MICLNSVMVPTARTSTTFRQVGAVHPGGEGQLGRSEDDRERVLGVLELVQEPAAPVALVGRHPRDVLGAGGVGLGRECRVQVVQRLAEFAGVVLVLAEDDGLGVGVGGGEGTASGVRR